MNKHPVVNQGRLTHPDVVLVGVEQDDGVAQDVDRVGVLEEVGALRVVVLAEGLHDSVDLLRLSRQPEGLQVQPDRHVEGEPCVQASDFDLRFECEFKVEH